MNFKTLPRGVQHLLPLLKYVEFATLAQYSKTVIYCTECEDGETFCGEHRDHFSSCAMYHKQAASYAYECQNFACSPAEVAEWVAISQGHFKKYEEINQKL